MSKKLLIALASSLIAFGALTMAGCAHEQTFEDQLMEQEMMEKDAMMKDDKMMEEDKMMKEDKMDK